MEFRRDTIRLRDLVLDDPVALQKWQIIVDHLILSAADRLRIKKIWEKFNYEEAVLETLERWNSYGTEKADIISVLRDNDLNALANHISEDLALAETISVGGNHARRRPQLAPPPSSGLKRRSEVNKGYVVLENYWVVSLARQPDNLRHQHAFLIIEGIRDDQAVIWFIDFVSVGGWTLGETAGKIRPYEYKQKLAGYPSDPQNALLFARQKFTDESMMNPKPTRTDRIIAITWQVEARKLMRIINAANSAVAENRFPKFLMTGQGSVFSYSSDFSSPDPEGPRHNCFTWAQSQLSTLQEPAINAVLANKDEFSWFANLTSRKLIDEESSSFWLPISGNKFSSFLLIILGIVFGYYFAGQK